jgi:hypothetical protein
VAWAKPQQNQGVGTEVSNAGWPLYPCRIEPSYLPSPSHYSAPLRLNLTHATNVRTTLHLGVLVYLHLHHRRPNWVPSNSTSTPLMRLHWLAQFFVLISHCPEPYSYSCTPPPPSPSQPQPYIHGIHRTPNHPRRRKYLILSLSLSLMHTHTHTPRAQSLLPRHTTSPLLRPLQPLQRTLQNCPRKAPIVARRGIGGEL